MQAFGEPLPIVAQTCLPPPGPLTYQSSLGLTTRRKGEWEFVTNNHLLKHLLNLGIGSRMNARKKATLNPLLMLELSKFRCGIFRSTNSSGWSKTSRRFTGFKRCLKSRAELRRLKTFTNESNWDELKSSTSFPRPKVLAHAIHKQTRLRRVRPI